MNDSDLAAKLRSVPVPERSEEYWSEFPDRVRRQLPRVSASSAAAPRRNWRGPLVWSGDFALVAALVFVCLQYHPVQAAATVFIRQDRCFQAQLARLDAGLHRLVLDTDGMGYLLTETE